MSSFKAVILDYQSLAPEDLDLTAWWQSDALEWQRFNNTAATETAERIAGADIILTNKVLLDKALLEKNPHIKLIIILATGTNNVDLEAAKALDIPVCNMLAYSTESVVQHTFALLLALQTRLIDYHRSVNSNNWSKSKFFGLLDYPIDEMAGKTLGIIGFGAIGERVKHVAEAFNMKVLVAQSVLPHAENKKNRVALNRLYQEADIISIHSPLSEYTANLIDHNAFILMKKTAVLINVGRGGIVNEEALLFALKNDQIGAAALDVLAQEPPSKSHPLVTAQLPNLIITPHTAWASVQSRQNLAEQVYQILIEFIAKKPLRNQVNL